MEDLGTSIDNEFTDTLLMIRPSSFGYDPETAKTNSFQEKPMEGPSEIQANALREFDNMVATLRDLGANVIVVDDDGSISRPNAVFPNNWVSFHADGTVVLYPMLDRSRRNERRPEIIDSLENDFGYRIRRRVDLSEHENEDKALEGTGSIVMDRRKNVAYACVSPRTDISLFNSLADRLAFEPISFKAEDLNGDPIYHTNLILGIGKGMALLCEEAIPDPLERRMLRFHLEEPGRDVIPVTFEQMKAFACNCYQIETAKKGPVLLLSRTACDSFTDSQLQRIETHTMVQCIPVDTIEKAGGGSVRCMIAGLYLNKEEQE